MPSASSTVISRSKSINPDCFELAKVISEASSDHDPLRDEDVAFITHLDVGSSQVRAVVCGAKSQTEPKSMNAEGRTIKAFFCTDHPMPGRNHGDFAPIKWSG